MNRTRQNIIAIFLAAALLFTGNFASAITYNTCEIECCEENHCCESDKNSNSETTAIVSGDNCCEVRLEQAVEQDYALLLIVKSNDKLKKETLKSDISIQSDYKKDYTRLITQKLKTTNIYLSVSNLRI